MKTRVAVDVATASAIFLAPFALQPTRLAHPAPWIGLTAALIVLLSQPALDPKQVSRDSADRGSYFVIFAGMVSAQVGAVIQFVLGRPQPVGPALVFGIAVTTIGMVLRLWSIRTLGRFFTSVVDVASDHQVVKSGPYRVLRHPSYTGALLVASGTAITLGSPIGIALVVTLCVPAYLYRIGIEERALQQQLGQEYVQYRRESWGLIPGLR